MVGNNTGPNEMGSADTTHRTNGMAGDKPAAHPFDPDFTRVVIEAMGPDTTPRNRVIFESLIRHLHDFTRDVELSYEEWMTGVDFINSLGKINTPKRNEAQRVSDILGLETLIDEISHKTAMEGKLEPTSSSILGPFWSAHAPFRDLGGSIIQDLPPKARVAKMHGVVRDMVTGEPIPNAVIDVWQASVNGQYDFQDPDNQTPNNLRGKFRVDDKGEYWFYCLYPTAYVLPTDGPSGRLLEILHRHPMRPAHMHVIVTHPEYVGCTTQLYPKDCPWVKSDTVFAVKPDLVVDFKPLEGDDKATLDLEYNMTLVPKNCQGKARE